MSLDHVDGRRRQVRGALPGQAEALLAIAIDLVAAIRAVIIDNHFSRSIKGDLELLNKASGAAGRQLPRGLDSMHFRPDAIGG